MKSKIIWSGIAILVLGMWIGIHYYKRSVYLSYVPQHIEVEDIIAANSESEIPHYCVAVIYKITQKSIDTISQKLVSASQYNYSSSSLQWRQGPLDAKLIEMFIDGPSSVSDYAGLKCANLGKIGEMIKDKAIHAKSFYSVFGQRDLFIIFPEDRIAAYIHGM